MKVGTVLYVDNVLVPVDSMPFHVKDSNNDIVLTFTKITEYLVGIS